MRLSLLPLREDDVLQLQCEGQISLRSAAPGARDPLEILLGPRCFTNKVLMSLERAEGIDTSGLSWLARAHERFQEHKGILVLFQVPPGVSTMLDYLKLTQLFHIAPNEATARAMAAGGDGVMLNPYRRPDEAGTDKDARVVG